MNEMYSMSVLIHYYSVLGVLGVIFINIMMLMNVSDMKKYKRQMMLWNPVGSVAIGSVIFTGIVMMAAKHLSFTIENIAMIIFAIFFIYLEVKRSKVLRLVDPKAKESLEYFKSFALKIYGLEIVGILLISFWMWMV